MNWIDSVERRSGTRRCLLLISLFLLPTVGCYEHVVGAKGYGTEGITIHESNIDDGSGAPSDADQRAKRRQDLKELNRSVPSAPRAY